MAKDERKPRADEPQGRERAAYLLRLPPELMDALKAWAAQDLRSLNAHLEYLLREAVKKRKGGQAP